MRTHSGLTIGEGIRVVGGDPDRLEEAKRTADEFAAFIEVHIEQGAFLHEEDIDIGVVVVYITIAIIINTITNFCCSWINGRCACTRIDTVIIGQAISSARVTTESSSAISTITISITI